LSEKAFQDYWDHNDCWGCGANNPHGLHIKSLWSGEESVCDWTPLKYYKAGPDGFLNGGIIATLIDCHSVASAIADAYRQEGRGLDSEPLLWCVTATMKIDYLRPVTISRAVNLKARIVKREGRKITVQCELFSKDTLCARADVLAVRVPPEKWYG
jgi:acyl-coenzyme A thioesterase PaaI-like protein